MLDFETPWIKWNETFASRYDYNTTEDLQPSSQCYLGDFLKQYRSALETIWNMKITNVNNILDKLQKLLYIQSQIRTIKIGPPDITFSYFPANTSSQFWWVGTSFPIFRDCNISHWVWILFNLGGFSSGWVCILFKRWWPTLTLWWRLRFGTNKSLDRWGNNSLSYQSQIDFFVKVIHLDHQSQIYLK